MASFDIFNNQAFSLQSLIEGIERLPFQPSLLGSLGIFETVPSRTTAISIEKREGKLVLVQTTQRGSPLPQGSSNPRDLRNFNTVRVAKGDRLTASEIQNIREFGSETELQQAVTEVARKMSALRADVELTHEHMRLGAVQGLLLDADGSTLYNFFNEWGVSQPAEIDFDLDNPAPVKGILLKRCKAVTRAMLKAAQGAWAPGASSIIGLCGDAFFDDLVAHPDVEKTYLNWQDAASLRQADVFDVFRFGGIDWVNYRGTDDGTSVSIPTDVCKFFPRGVPGAFKRVNGPGETMDLVNQPGRDFYPMVVPDLDRNMFVDVEVYSYPLYVPCNPSMLLRAKRT